MGAAAELHLVPPPRTGLVRVGYQPDPFIWREPKRLSDEDDGRPGPLLAGNRFDAPDREFRTLYFATDQHGAWLEKLARVSPVASLPGRIDASFDDDPDPEYDKPLVAELGYDFFDPPKPKKPLVLGEAGVDRAARFIDVEHHDTLTTLNQRVGRPFLSRFGLERFDRGVPSSADRRITRALALELYEIAKPDPTVIGIRFTSVHAAGVECWALWEHGISSLHDHSLAPVDLTTPALRDAATILRIQLPPPPEPAPLPEHFPDAW